MLKVESWFQRDLDLLQQELAELDHHQIRYELDQEALGRGKVRITVWHRVNDRDLELVALFPDTYPYFRFELQAADLSLPRHQNPFGKNLCLIGRSTENWHTNYTLAQFVLEQVPRVLNSAAGTSNGEGEERQGEPASDYYPYELGTSVLIDSSWRLEPDVARGEFTIGLQTPLIQGDDLLPLRGVLLQVRDAHGKRLADAPPALQALYKQPLEGRWFRIEDPIFESDADRLVAAIAQQHPSARHFWESRGRSGAVVAAVFPEELRWRKFGDGWLFAVSMARRNSYKPSTYLARAGRAGSQDMGRRIPELAPLNLKTVGIVGLGCIGAPSAFHFARAQVRELRVLDSDFVESGSIVRWPLGMGIVGRRKTEVVQQFIRDHYPYTTVKASNHRIGATEEPEARILTELFDGIDLLYDASAELGVNHLLSDLARKARIPYICVSGTLGGWGGRIIRIRPDKTEGCWICARLAAHVGDIPDPPASQELVQPEGCANPTFTGAHFDLEEMALMGVRLAASTLCEGAEGYPAIDWDIAVLRLRDEAGVLSPAPAWTTHQLRRHDKCPNCLAR